MSRKINTHILDTPLFQITCRSNKSHTNQEDVEDYMVTLIKYILISFSRHKSQLVSMTVLMKGRKRRLVLKVLKNVVRTASILTQNLNPTPTNNMKRSMLRSCLLCVQINCAGDARFNYCYLVQGWK